MTPITCQVVAVHDGDGPIHCANGVRIRVAGVQAPDYESATPCRQHRAGYVCNDAAADRSKRITEGLTLGQTLRCYGVGVSYRRVVARCSVGGRDLSCALIAAGAAVEWPAYWRRYGMGRC